MHIIESILSQEELPDFYEENLNAIAEILQFIFESDYPHFPSVPLELIKCRHKAVRLIHLYQFKFAEYFANFSQFFF